MEAHRSSPREPAAPAPEARAARAPNGPPPADAARGVVRRHPVIAGVLLGCTVAGALLGCALLTPDWSLVRRLLAGAFAGAGTGLLITATKMF